MKILNLTQHPASPDQKDLVEPKNKEELKRLLTFDVIPDKERITNIAMKIAMLAKKETRNTTIKAVMIGGAPFLMSLLEKALKEVGYDVYYSFSARKSVETVLEDGTVQKSSVFKHVGFIKT